MKNTAYQNGVRKAEARINAKMGNATAQDDGTNAQMQNEMKQKWNMTLSGGDPSFKKEGPKLFEVFTGTHNEAQKRRGELERKLGKIVYMALKIPQ